MQKEKMAVSAYTKLSYLYYLCHKMASNSQEQQTNRQYIYVYFHCQEDPKYPDESLLLVLPVVIGVKVTELLFFHVFGVGKCTRNCIIALAHRKIWFPWYVPFNCYASWQKWGEALEMVWLFSKTNKSQICIILLSPQACFQADVLTSTRVL